MSKYLYYFFSTINKKFTIGSRPSAGRNFSGTICVHHKAGGNKNKYLLVDFYRRLNSYGYIYKIIKNLNFTAFLGGIIYENGLFSYIILSETLKLRSRIYSGSYYQKGKDELGYIGMTVPLKKISLFALVNNIEKYPFSGGSIIRAAGSSGILTSKFDNKISLKLKSG
jgi:ribosomal protein L2